MADDADSRGIDIGHVGEGRVTIGGDVGKGGKRLKLWLACAGLAQRFVRRIETGEFRRPDRQDDKAPFGQWIAEVTSLPAQADPGFRIVENDEHGGESAGRIADCGFRVADWSA